MVIPAAGLSAGTSRSWGKHFTCGRQQGQLCPRRAAPGFAWSVLPRGAGASCWQHPETLLGLGSSVRSHPARPTVPGDTAVTAMCWFASQGSCARSSGTRTWLGTSMRMSRVRKDPLRDPLTRQDGLCVLPGGCHLSQGRVSRPPLCPAGFNLIKRFELLKISSIKKIRSARGPAVLRLGTVPLVQPTQ